MPRVGPTPWRARATAYIASGSSNSGSDDPSKGAPVERPKGKGAEAYRIGRVPAEPLTARAAPTAASAVEAVAPDDSFLSAMTPSSMTEIEAATVIFEAPALRAAAGVEEVPEVYGGSEARIVKRYDLALTRLHRKLSGATIKWLRPKSRVELELWAEEVADAITASPKRSTAGGVRTGGAIRYEEGREEIRSFKPSEPTLMVQRGGTGTKR